jgi:hypothetical protein
MWSTRWLNDMGPCPWFATPDRRRDGIPAQLVPTIFGPGLGLSRSGGLLGAFAVGSAEPVLHRSSASIFCLDFTLVQGRSC